VILLFAAMAVVLLLPLGCSGGGGNGDGAGAQEASKEAYTGTGSNTPTAAGQSAPAKPNFVFILADDMRKDDLKYMPKTRSLLAQQGMRFNNAFVSNALCCPSRATIMRGQYSHNNGVWTNRDGSDGGWEGYKSNGNEQDNVATRLDGAGYRTALIGKYLNNYQGTAVPQGWDHWFGKFNDQYFDYDVNDNGTIRHFGTSDGDYATDVLRSNARHFIDTSVSQGKPFFAYVAPSTPHSPFVPAPRDEHAYEDEKAPRSPSFNEADVSDKPPWIRSLPRHEASQIADIDRRYEQRAEMLQALDDLVGGVVSKLKSAGELSDTYVFFTSDNGWHHGEHRIRQGKWRPYEEDIRMPLLVRGPGVAASTTSKLALNTDFFPTFTDLAGIPTPGYVDGRSLRPVLKGNSTTWRSAILLEGVSGQVHTYYGIRTSSDSSKYVEYEGGVRELYYLGADPYELSNEYDAAAPPAMLALRLQALKGCAGATCRAAEDGQLNYFWVDQVRIAQSPYVRSEARSGKRSRS
jgi:N-acetylglucosamine-6-sulfatase